MTTYPVLVESVHLMFRRIGVAKTLAWMEVLSAQGVGVFAMGGDHLPRLTELMRQYCRFTDGPGGCIPCPVGRGVWRRADSQHG